MLSEGDGESTRTRGGWNRPRHHACVLCGAPATSRLCPGCRDELPWLEHACARCGLPADRPVARCGACLERPPAFDRCRAALHYAEPAAHLVQRFKFHGELACGAALAEAMAMHLRLPPGARPALLIPVPLARDRLRRRGFNQALELARPLARRLAIPLAATLAERRRPTRPQSDLDAAARRRNVRGAFALRADSVPAHVALFDDVVTTGSTVDALARLLKDHGAERVDVFCCARA